MILAQINADSAKDWSMATAFVAVTIIPFIKWILENKGKHELEKEKLNIWYATKDSNIDIAKKMDSMVDQMSNLNVNLVKEQITQDERHKSNLDAIRGLQCKADCKNYQSK